MQNKDYILVECTTRIATNQVLIPFWGIGQIATNQDKEINIIAISVGHSLILITTQE